MPPRAKVIEPFEVKYKAPETLRRFMLSDAMMRGVRGPVRSGKSSCSVTEIMRRGLQQKPGKRGIKRVRVGVIRNCYDSQTEILTEQRGWVKFQELSTSDKVAMLQDGQMVFTQPTYYYKAPYAGEMVGIRSQNVDILVTPDHKLWVSGRRTRKKTWGQHELKKAQEIYGIGELWRMSSESTGCSAGGSAVSEDFFEFLGFWFAEGYAGVYERAVGSGSYHYRLVVSQKKHCPYVDDLLKRCGLKYGRSDKGGGNFNYSLSTAGTAIKELISKLVDCGQAKTKRIPSWIKNAPIGHLKAFLYGHQMGDGRFKNGPHSCDQHCTSSAGLADDLQEILARTGRASTVTGDASGYDITVLTKQRSNPVIQKRHWRKEHYDGHVYCVEVPTHVVYVRRNGKAVWCSQTYRELKDTTVKTWLDWYPESEVGPFRWTDMDHIIKRGDLEMELNFRALDRPDHVAHLKSMEWTFAWINEAAEIAKSIVLMARDRVGQFPSRKDEGVTWGGVFMDTNSMDDDHWWPKLEEEKPAGWAFFDQPGGLIEVENGKFVANPRAENMEALGPDYYTSRIPGNSLEHIRVFYCNQYGFVRQGQPVIPEFAEALHVAPRKLEPVKGVPIRVGLDFGLTPAAIIGQKLVDGRWLWLREIESYELGGTGIQTFAPILIDYIQANFAGHEIATIYGDPAGDERDPIKETDTVFRILNAELKPYNMKAQAAPVPGNSFTIRREVLAGALNRNTGGHPRVMFCPSMKTTIKGLKGGYYYRRIQVAGEDRFQNEPVKTRHSHLIEAGEYMMLGAGEGVSLLRGKRKEEAVPEAQHLYAGRDRAMASEHAWMG